MKKNPTYRQGSMSQGAEWRSSLRALGELSCVPGHEPEIEGQTWELGEQTISDLGVL